MALSFGRAAARLLSTILRSGSNGIETPSIVSCRTDSYSDAKSPRPLMWVTTSNRSLRASPPRRGGGQGGVGHASIRAASGRSGFAGGSSRYGRYPPRRGRVRLPDGGRAREGHRRARPMPEDPPLRCRRSRGRPSLHRCQENDAPGPPEVQGRQGLAQRGASTAWSRSRLPSLRPSALTMVAEPRPG